MHTTPHIKVDILCNRMTQINPKYKEGGEVKHSPYILSMQAIF